MKRPFFTIIMPTFNQAEFIENSLKSIFGQDADSYELLVYDALSTDDTQRILEKYKDKLIWHREKDSGMSEAINKGLMAGNGEVFAWLCSDDMYLPNTFSLVMEAFTQNPEHDFVYGDVLEMDRNGSIFTPNLFTEDYNPYRYLFSHNYISQPTAFFKKSAFEKVGLLREDIILDMDYEWFARFHMAGLKAKRLPFFLAANRDHPETKTNSSGMRRYKNMLRVHAMRPGMPLLFRKSFWVYTLEALIKACNAIMNSQRPGTFLRRIFSFISKIGGDVFLRFVNPQSKNDIIYRFQKDIEPRGKNIQDQWKF